MPDMTEEQVLAVALASDLRRAAGQGPVETKGVPTAIFESAVPRSELVEFVRCICEGEPFARSKKVQGQRAIELAAWEIYRRLQEAGEI